MKHFKEFNFWVYILFDERAKATYIGMTNDLERRIIEHKMRLLPGFTKEKNIHKLGYLEHYKYVDQPIAREKALKKWNRAWKYSLIETMNPEWKDLADGVDEYIAMMPKT
jgi:putative endonuclease